MGAKGVEKALKHEREIEESEEAPRYKFEDMRKNDSRIVKGKFVNRECPGGILSFHYKLYKGDPVTTYKLKDGMEYELPIGVVKHILNNCQVEEDTHTVKLVDPHTLQPLYDKRMIPRFAFISSEFVA